MKTICPICAQHSSWFIRTLKGSRTGRHSPLYACLACDFLFQRPDYHESEQQTRLDFEWHVAKLDEQRHRSQVILDQLAALHPRAISLLDIGCGPGVSVKLAKERGWQATGVEPNPYAVHYAQEHFGLDIINGYFQARLFSEPFDMVIVDNVLEHVADMHGFITATLTVLARKGVLFLAIPGRHHGLIDTLFALTFPRHPKSLFFDNDVHINHFSRRAMVRLLQPHDAVIVRERAAGEYFIQRKVN